jgi:hypothetical protein
MTNTTHLLSNVDAIVSRESDDLTMESQLDIVSEVLKANRFCILATSGRDGRPWATPLFYNYDASYVLYWESARDTRHTRLIEENPNVAIAIPDMDGVRGVYFEGIAGEVPPGELDQALDRFLNGPHERDRGERTAEDFGPDRPLGLYYARPVSAYLMTGARKVDGYLIDERVPIALPVQAAGP